MNSAILISALALVSAVPAKADGKLTVYTYESFTAEWGPGPKVKQAFEKQCNCTVDFVSVTDGVALLNRLKLEGASSKADIVLGLDTNLTFEASETGLFAPHGIDTSGITIPGGYKDNTFVPYDYGYFAVIYDSETLKNPPASLKELVEGDPKQKIVIEDPRTSTPGLGLLLWVKSVYGDKAGEAWSKLKDRVLTVTPGWSEAYGLFTKGEAPMVLSYTTSPAYHLVAEKTDRYKAAAFEEGHYLQVEVAAQTTNGAKNPLSAQFLSFHDRTGVPGRDPGKQLDVPGCQDERSAQSGFRHTRQACKDFDLLPGGSVEKPQGMDRRMAVSDEPVTPWQLPAH